ncbi:DNA alkylation repair protein [Aquamicrobium sp. LC103]|uniref:DNA alkylation repair protein n=1 Tax=Aquamicrobium sp. LC103 TaxID=1120658 RepID=UPI00063EA9FA|nr:DNA alkylation repair protein [Aquamicrobium sp. LC103]TKT79166.1 DNA alkylation repair protein [Aquamicrobium sp. LC103]
MTAALSRASTADEILGRLNALASGENRAGLARYGINAENALGIPHGELRAMSKVVKRDHERALALWESGFREARVLAAMTDEPGKVTIGQCRRWADEFNSWDIVDSVSDLFVATPFWRELVGEFAADEREFVRRTAFAMIAWANVPRNKVPEETLLSMLPLIERHADDPRNFVKKAVNWALRATGKNSPALHAAALDLARELAGSEDKTRRWVGKDAVRDLTSEKTKQRLEGIANKVSGKPAN